MPCRVSLCVPPPTGFSISADRSCYSCYGQNTYHEAELDASHSTKAEFWRCRTNHGYPKPVPNEAARPREKNSTRVQMTREDAKACLERSQPQLGSAHNTIQGEKQRNQTEGHSKEARPKTKIAEGKNTQMSTCKFQNPVIRNQSNRYDSRTEPKALLPENNNPEI